MTTALEGGVSGQQHAPATLYPRVRPGTHFIGGWVGPRAGLDQCGKPRPPQGFDPRTVQPVASGYTDRAIPAHVGDQYGKFFTSLPRDYSANLKVCIYGRKIETILGG